MRRLILSLAATSNLVGGALCWLMAMPAAASVATSGVVQHVSGPMLDINEAQVCVMSTHSRFNLVCTRSQQIAKQAEIGKPIDQAADPQASPQEFVFSEQESNAAIALFGCDCPTCMNALRSLRLMAVS
jgi:hypothetical protein